MLEYCFAFIPVEFLQGMIDLVVVVVIHEDECSLIHLYPLNDGIEEYLCLQWLLFYHG